MGMNDKQLLDEFSTTRNLNKATIDNYKRTLTLYTQQNKMTIQELLDEADAEEEAGIRWKKRKLKTRLIKFREFLYDKYAVSSASTHFFRLITFYKHHEIEIHELPQRSKKNDKLPEPVMFKDLPDKDIIKQALKVATPFMRAVILFMSSSGCARAETLSLTIQDFIDATKEYHNQENIIDVITTLKKRDDVIPMFKIRRIKTNKYYFTFCSPEAVSEILNYLLTRQDLNPTAKLFRKHKVNLSRNFINLNNKLNLGKKGTYNRLRSHNLRKFHASQLYNDGMKQELVDALQGRSKEATTSAYFFENPNKLREVYVNHMNSVTINLDVNNLDIKSPEYVKLETELENEKRSNQEKIKELEEKFETLSQSMLDKIL